jgi:hypothetical protein
MQDQKGSWLVPIVVGLISTAAVIASLVAVEAWSGFALQSFSLLFVLPVGAAFAGAGCGSGVFGVLLWQGKRPTRFHSALAAILGAVGFIGTYLADYLTTYVDKNLNLNHSFAGIPLSAVMSFPDYLKMDVASRTSTFFINVGHAMIPLYTDHGIALGAPINWVGFAMEAFGFVIGGILVGNVILGDRKYCELCRVYMKSKPIFRTLPEQYNAKVEVLNQVLAAGIELRNLAAKERGTKIGKKQHIAFTMEYCPHCFDGYLLIKPMSPTRNGFEEIREHRQTIRLEKATIHDYVASES